VKCEVTFQPSGKKIVVRPGTSVLEASRKAGVAIRTRCGGKAACLMCKVYAKAGDGLSPVQDNERRKLAGLADEGMRLACQARVVGQAEIGLPEDPLRAAVRRQLARQAEDDLW
jgi:2Fe-2S ferredoxin